MKCRSLHSAALPDTQANVKYYVLPHVVTKKDLNAIRETKFF